MTTTIKLSKTQAKTFLDALETSRGLAFGEYSCVRTSTAEALVRLGLVEKHYTHEGYREDRETGRRWPISRSRVRLTVAGAHYALGALLAGYFGDLFYYVDRGDFDRAVGSKGSPNARLHQLGRHMAGRWS